MNNDFFEKNFAVLKRTVKKIFADAPTCHDYDHTLRVLKNASTLAQNMPDADLQVVQIAALLHDIGRPHEAASPEVCHAETGAALAEALLKKRKFEPEFVEKVRQAIFTHRYRKSEKPQSLEAKIVFDADKLDSLGAIGIGRAFLFAGHEGAKLHNSAAEALASAPYSSGDTAYREYLVKLRHLPECMQTAIGKKLALKQKKFMDDFFKALNAQNKGKIL